MLSKEKLSDENAKHLQSIFSSLPQSFVKGKQKMTTQITISYNSNYCEE